MASRSRLTAAAVALCLTIGSAVAQLSGTYTIDPAGSGARNYKTFAAATTALQAGISGPVTFHVASTTFLESVVIDPVTGASSTNTVTFVATGQPATIDANGAKIALHLQYMSAWIQFRNLRFIGWTASGMLFLGGVPPIHDCVFEKLEVTSSRTPSGHAVELHQADDNTFRDCVFRAGSDSAVYFYMSHRNLIERCELDGRGIARRVLFITNAWTNDDDNIYQNCFIHSSRSHSTSGCCVQLASCAYGSIFANNTVLANTEDSAVKLGGIAGSWAKSLSFKNNIVVNLGTGPAVEFFDTASYP